jgi:hypothetical protein
MASNSFLCGIEALCDRLACLPKTQSVCCTEVLD